MLLLGLVWRLEECFYGHLGTDVVPSLLFTLRNEMTAALLAYRIYAWIANGRSYFHYGLCFGLQHEGRVCVDE